MMITGRKLKKNIAVVNSMCTAMQRANKKFHTNMYSNVQPNTTLTDKGNMEPLVNSSAHYSKLCSIIGVQTSKAYCNDLTHDE